MQARVRHENRAKIAVDRNSLCRGSHTACRLRSLKMGRQSQPIRKALEQREGYLLLIFLLAGVNPPWTPSWPPVPRPPWTSCAL